MGKVHPPWPPGITGEDRCPHCGSSRPHSFCFDMAPTAEQIDANLRILDSTDDSFSKKGKSKIKEFRA